MSFRRTLPSRYTVPATADGMNLATRGFMFRRLAFLILAIAGLAVMPRQASAYYDYDTTSSYFPSAGGYTYYYTFTPKPPKATHDSRMDSHLLRAAKIAEANAFPRSTMRCWRY